MTIEKTAVPIRHDDRFFIGGNVGRALLLRRHRGHRLGDRGAVLQRPRGHARPTWPGRSTPPARRSTAARGRGCRTRSGPSTCGRSARDCAGKADEVGQLWPRESGALHIIAQHTAPGMAGVFDFYAGLADTYPFEERAQPTMGGEYGLLVREPVGVVGAIIPWNAPIGLISYKIAPALLAGCTVVLKSSPEAPGDAYLFAEIAEDIGLPPGVLNVVTADREVSELLVRNPGVDKITFTGSTAAGRRIASLCGERIARCTLELGGKSAAVILDDMDLAGGGRRHLGRRVLPLRAGVLLADAHHRQPFPPRRVRRDPRRHVLSGQGRRPLRRADPDGAAGHGAASATGSRATSPRASPRAQPWRPAAAGPRTSSAATTSSRRSSATSTTTRRSPRRRSSGRCSA